MSRLSFVQDKNRLGLYVPMGQTKEDPSLVIPFYKMDRSELEEIVRANLEKQGITDETHIQTLIDEAETQYEKRKKEHEAHLELKRLMKIREDGGKLMQVGYRKWKQAFYPGVKK